MLNLASRPFVPMIGPGQIHIWAAPPPPRRFVGHHHHHHPHPEKAICIDDLFIPPQPTGPLIRAAPVPSFSGHVFIVLDCELPDITPSRLQTAPEQLDDEVAHLGELHGNQIISLGVLVVMQTSDNADDPNQFLVLEQTYISLDMLGRVPRLTSSPCSKTHWEDIWAKLNWGQPGWSFWSRRIATLNRLFVATDKNATLVASPYHMAQELDSIIRRWSAPPEGPPMAFAATEDDDDGDGSEAFYARPLGCSVMFDTGSQDQYFINELLVTNGFRPLFMNSRHVYAGPFSVIDSFAVFCGAYNIRPGIGNKELQARKNAIKANRTSFLSAHSRYGLRPPASSEDHNPLWDAYTTFAYYAAAQRHSAAMNTIAAVSASSTVASVASRSVPSAKKVKTDPEP